MSRVSHARGESLRRRLLRSQDDGRRVQSFPLPYSSVATRQTKSARRFVVRGCVQGVGYRSFAQNAASLTGVSGWVRNLDDGSVEAVASGTQEQLDAFAGYLHMGPRWGEVRAVDVSECAPLAASGFSIKY